MGKKERTGMTAWAVLLAVLMPAVCGCAGKEAPQAAPAAATAGAEEADAGSTVQAPDGPAAPEDSGAAGDAEGISLADTKDICITDPVDRMYEDYLDVHIEGIYVNSFLEFCGDIEETDEYPAGKPLYTVRFLAGRRKTAEEWMVFDQGGIHEAGGRNYVRSGKLDEWLSTVEKKYGVRERDASDAPGRNYMGLMEIVDRAVLEELPETKKGRIVTEIPMISLKTLLSGFGAYHGGYNKKGDVKDQFIIKMYTKSGELLFTIGISENGTLSLNDMYEIPDNGLRNQCRKLIKETRRIKEILKEKEDLGQ